MWYELLPALYDEGQVIFGVRHPSELTIALQNERAVRCGDYSWGLLDDVRWHRASIPVYDCCLCHNCSVFSCSLFDFAIGQTCSFTHPIPPIGGRVNEQLDPGYSV